jgi:hypothetical protein
VTFTNAEARVREVLTYTDAYGSANKTTGRRPAKIVTKTGDGTLVLDDVASANRTASVVVSGGTAIIVETDTDLTTQINGDGRGAGDNVAAALEQTFVWSDGTVQVSASVSATK